MAKLNLTLDERFTAARVALEAAGQSHVLKFWDTLTATQRDNLLSQIEGIDWPEVTRLIESHVKNKPKFELPGKVDPAPWYPFEPAKGKKRIYTKARKLGESLVAAGKVAAFTVAGGQGTRLGWDGPKGTFPATPIRKIALFECMAEYIRKSQSKYDCVIPWYIMTSPINDSDTRTFFEKHEYLGLDPANVMLFPQAMMPAIAMHPGGSGAGVSDVGKVLLEAVDSLALSPNGHGGSLKALFTSGAIEDMKRRGIEHISYTQVDNPIVRIIDPQFIGLHAQDNCQMSSKMLPKAYPKEKLGNFCLVDGKMTVIEYSDLPDELAEQRVADGSLRFRAGSIAIHCIRTDFVESLNTRPGGFALPFHRAEKKVGCIGLATGEKVDVKALNAVKLETFVFDALPMCEASIIYETDRVDEFAPIKNADAGPGQPLAVDCPATSKLSQTERAARWLEAKGVKVPRDAEGKVQAVIEISQLTAIEPGDLGDVELPESVEPGTQLLL